jgi:hypothetical protein
MSFISHSHIAVEQGVSVVQPHFIIFSTSDGATLMFGGSVTRTMHLTRSSRSHPYSADSRADLQMAVEMCARFTFYLNASLESESDQSSGTFVPVFLPILRDQTSLRTSDMLIVS